MYIYVPNKQAQRGYKAESWGQRDFGIDPEAINVMMCLRDGRETFLRDSQF